MSQIDGFVITPKPAAHVGPGAIGELPGVVRAVGADQVVVVTDAALAAAPVIATVRAVLADAGLPARLFADVHPQPTTDDLAAGADAVAQAAAEAATEAAASASTAAVAAMLRPSAPLVASPPPATFLAAHSASGYAGSWLPATHFGSAHLGSAYSGSAHLGSAYSGSAYSGSAHSGSVPLGAHSGAGLPAAPPAPAVSSEAAVARIVLVAVGGRAPIDAAKGIAIAAVNPQRGRDLDCRRDFAVPALPIVAVPTTAGPGAETSAFGAVTDPADRRRFYVGHASTMPVAAILDPALTVGLPPAATAAAGLDALTRALESYLSPRPNPWSDGIALQVIRMIAGSLPRAVADGKDLAARSQMLLAAHMAGVAAASTGLGLCHAIGRSLGARWDIADGAAMAMLLPDVLRLSLPARVERMADVAFALGVGDTHADTWLNAEAAIGAVTALRDDVGLNRLIGDVGITEADFGQIVADVGDDEVLAGPPLPSAADDIRAILRAAAGRPR